MAVAVGCGRLACVVRCGSTNSRLALDLLGMNYVTCSVRPWIRDRELTSRLATSLRLSFRPAYP